MATSNGDTPGGDAGDLGALTDRYARAGGPAERMTAGLVLAAGLSEKGRYLEAIRVLQEIAGAAAGPAQRAQVLRQQGWIHLRLSEYEKAYQLLGEALELLSAHNSLDLFQVYYDIAWMFYRQGYLENARNYCDGARMVLESLAGAPAEAVARARVELLHITALIDAAAGDHRAAAAGLATEIEAHRGSGDDYRLCGACSKMASVLLAQGDVAGALRYQRQAHEIAQRRGEDFRLALSHKNYGDIYYVIGDLERSLEHYRQSRQLAQSLHNRLGEVFSGGGIGRVLCCRGDCPAALEQYLQTLAEAHDLGNRDRETCLLVDMAELHCRCGHPADAAACLERAESIEADRGLALSPRHALAKARVMLDGGAPDAAALAEQLLDGLLASPILIDDEEMVTVPELEIAAHALRARALELRGDRGAAAQDRKSVG